MLYISLCSFFDEEKSRGNLEFALKNATNEAATEIGRAGANKRSQHGIEQQREI
jgi:hypothetical protein